jgi:NADH dehydrogenase
MMKTRIPIIGGGFGGLKLVRYLAGKEEFDVALVDMNNYHLFPPL